jgi:hypothetical protein
MALHRPEGSRRAGRVEPVRPGVAYPGLRARAWRLTEGMASAKTAQVHFRLAGDFLLALRRLDLSRPNIAARLISTA